MTANDYRAPEQGWPWEGSVPPVGTEYEADEQRWDSQTRQTSWVRTRYRVEARVLSAPSTAGTGIFFVSQRVLDSKPCPRCHGHGVLVREPAS